MTAPRHRTCTKGQAVLHQEPLRMFGCRSTMPHWARLDVVMEARHDVVHIMASRVMLDAGWSLVATSGR
jgi:hypothetical protein